jgi:GMP synthase-like glutamine amidotransferase
VSEQRHSTEPGLILRHGEDGPEGLLGEWLDERGIAYAVHDIAAGPLPPLGGAAFVASLGSEESARDDGLPWVAAELELLRGAVAADVPVLGLCFGGQALALALGGEVGPARSPQIGWYELTGEAVPVGPWFHWHYEQLVVPPGATALAESPVGPAAFELGPHLGVQFHPEVTLAVISAWARAEHRLAELGIERPALLAESARRLRDARANSWRLFDRWWARAAVVRTPS